MQFQLQEAQDRYKISADESRKEHPLLQVGDKVWLLRRNIKTTQPCDKLDYQRTEQFPIQKQINQVAYRLTSPASMKVHPVFYVSLLEPYKESNIPGRTQPPPPCIEIDSHEEYEVEKVLDLRQRRGRLEYLVHWRGYDINECIWEPSTNLTNAPQKVQKFHRRYPHMPKSLI
jgi:hypothetical protein